MNSREIGFAKEKEVAEHLKKLGYKILETNFSCKFGEIDIIAKHKKAVVFVEVRYRKSQNAGTPQETVTFAKQQKIIKSAITYIKQNNLKMDFRFDIAAVEADKITVIESAFTVPESQYYI